MNGIYNKKKKQTPIIISHLKILSKYYFIEILQVSILYLFYAQHNNKSNLPRRWKLPEIFARYFDVPHAESSPKPEGCFN